MLLEWHCALKRENYRQVFTCVKTPANIVRPRGQAEGAYSGTRAAASDCGQAQRAMATYTTSQNPAGAPAAGPAADACAFDASADYSQSFHLRVAAFFIICACSSAGVLVPLLTRLRPQMNGTQRGGWLFIAKAFGAGVILAVGLIHVFPDASTTLSDPCLGAGTLVRLCARALLPTAAPCTCRPLLCAWLAALVLLPAQQAWKTLIPFTPWPSTQRTMAAQVGPATPGRA